MPAKVKVRILAGRNLPVMDKSSDASDAFVEVKLGNTTYKTEVYRRSLNPFWNSEWFRFEVSDQELQDEPLQIRIMDYDTYSANDAIGKVYINLNPLLLNPGRSMNGWLPIYDTLHGIRGEINCMVKVNLFADNNRFRHSSCGVRFFFSDIPNGYKCDAILGFVDELLVNDDPEYQWIDKIRTPRASNEARQTLFTKLSGEVQRKLGLKAEVFGGNAVIGYQQSFDLEGSSGIVGRGIGTAVVLSKIGHQYEGVISPLSLCNNVTPYPYFSDTNQSMTRSASHFFPVNRPAQQLQQTDRHLVHSLSADYFYEVPSKLPPKKLSNALDSILSTKINVVSTSDQNETSDVETFVSLQKIEDDATDIDPDDEDDIPDQADTNGSPPNETTVNRSRRFMFAAFSSNKNESSLKHSRSLRHESSRSFLTKIIPNNETTTLVVRKLVDHVKRPVLSQATSLKLIRKLPYRKANTSSRPETYQQADDGPTKTSRGDLQHQSGSSGSWSQQRSSTSPSAHSQSLDSTNTATQSTSTSAQLNKKRKEKLLSPSTIVDDALSIIEEKLDDDDGGALRPSLEPSPRERLFSSSSNRSKQFVRSREVDLSGDSERPPSAALNQLTRQKKISVSSVDSEEMDENLVSDALSTSTIDTKTSPPPTATATATGDSVESTSSPSASILTDETIRENERLPAGPKDSGPPTHRAPEAAKSSKLRRSNTDSSRPKQEAENIPPQRVEVTSPGAGKRKHSLRHAKTSQNPNFIQSVKVVKAQQHLLQNIIKHQNQNLVVSSMQKAKNAFMYPNRIHQSEYPFVTLKRYPEALIQCTGGVVSAHSVKLLNHSMNDEESETRDIWWTELRKEIRSHAKSLNCNTILGYSETSKVLGDVCILSARGTAAIMKPLDHPDGPHSSSHLRHQATGSNALRTPRLAASPATHSSMPPLHRNDSPSEQYAAAMRSGVEPSQNRAEIGASPGGSCAQTNLIDCSFCHTPLICVESVSSLADCSICKSNKVPDVLLLTIEPPKSLNIVSSCALVQARVCRIKRDSHGEASAKEIGDALPFLEYELHRQLFSKLKFKGMNCLFNLNIDISIGENMLTGLATGTGCFVLGLPTPEVPQISAGKGIKATKLGEIRKLISLSAIKNRQLLGLDRIELQLAEYHQQTRGEGSGFSEIDYDDEQADDGCELGVKRPANKALTPTPTSGEKFDSLGQRPSSSMGIASASEWADPASAEEQRAVSSKAGKSTETNSGDSNRNQNNKRLHVDQQKRAGQLPITSRTGDQTTHSRRHQHRRGHKHSQEHGNEHHHRHHHHHRHLAKHHHHRKSARLSTSMAPTENLINMAGDGNNIVLEVDDNEDADIIALLIDSDIPEGFLICNSETMPTISQQSIESINMFTQVIRVKLNGLDQFAQQFDWVLQALMVKQRRSLPCCLTNMNFVVDLPEAHVVQITVTGSLLALKSSSPSNSSAASSSMNLDSQDVGEEQTTKLENGAKEQPAKKSTARQSTTGNSAPYNKKAASSTSMSPTSLSPSSNNESESPTSSEPEEATLGARRSSSSSSSSSSSPTAASSSSKDNSTSSSSTRGQRKATAIPVKSTNSAENANQTTSNETKQSTLAKQFSKGNIVALLNAGKSTFTDRKSKSSGSKSAEKIELAETPLQATLLGRMSQQHQQRQQERSARSLRMVFKKQQTYPGAISPPISGQENLLAKLASMRRRDSGARLALVSQKSVASDTRQPTSSGGAAAAVVNRLSAIGKAHLQQASSTTTDEPSLVAEQLDAGPVKAQQGHRSHHRRHQHRSASSNQELVSQKHRRGGGGGSSLNSSIDITSLSYIPGAKDYHYLGNLTFSFVRETNSVRENGGLNGFIHCFLMEVYAIVRAHVSALGGNAFLSFRLQQSCIFYHSNKNQAQCLISVAGDAVQAAM